MTMKSRTPRWYGVLVLAVFGNLAAGAPPVFPGDSQSTSLSGEAPGVVVHIDPTTGAILTKPVPGSVPLQLTPQLSGALSTSHQGLVDIPGRAADDGVKLDLQGRFQSVLVVTIDANGKARIQHLDGIPAIADQR